jgi:hypothetical protein
MITFGQYDPNGIDAAEKQPDQIKAKVIYEEGDEVNLQSRIVFFNFDDENNFYGTVKKQIDNDKTGEKEIIIEYTVPPTLTRYDIYSATILRQVASDQTIHGDDIRVFKIVPTGKRAKKTGYNEEGAT